MQIHVPFHLKHKKHKEKDTGSDVTASKTPEELRVVVYIMYFFFTLHYVFPLYINSNFLNTLISDTATSIAFAIAAVLAIATMSAVARALPKFGNFYTTLALIIAEIIAIGILAIQSAPTWILISAFMAHWLLTAVIRFNLDVFLEKFTDNSKTGEIRGTLVTLTYIAFLIGPLIAGFVANNDAFWQIYLISGIVILPLLTILLSKFKDFPDSDYANTTLWKSLKKVWQDINVRFILGAMLILHIFYAMMVVYTPIYLHQYVGLSFSSIGIIFSIMLIPFVLLGRPLGEISDRYLGEKELLIAGFIIAAFFTALLAFITSTEIWVWGALLFGTRIGATMIEVMSDGYFFKQVESFDTDELSVLRMIRPFAYIVAPVIASVILLLAPFHFIFFGAAVLLLIGALITLPIVDTL
jgi:MFS family permease